MSAVTAKPDGGETAPIDIGSRRELFVDDFLIDEYRGGALLQLHRPVPREVVIVPDQPWEKTCGYVTVFRDGNRCRMYYYGAVMDVMEFGVENLYVGYAESRDGRHWEKPRLGLVEFDGSRNNNIVWKGKASHGFTVFKDANPCCPDEEQYKAIGGVKAKTYAPMPEGSPLSTGQRYLFALKSQDGLQWSLMDGLRKHGAVLDQAEGDFDSQNLAFWDARRGEYRIYFRMMRDLKFRAERAATESPEYRVRDIKTAASADFLNWSTPEFLSYGNAPDEEMYTNGVIPYYRAPHMYLGFPRRYVEARGPRSEWHRQKAAETPGRSYTSYTDGLFMSSRDGHAFRRWERAFIRPGMPEDEQWGYGVNTQAWGIVETASDVPGAPNELSFFVSEGNSRPCLRRYTMRLDGFVSVEAPLSGGEVLTKPLVFEGDGLVLNMATSAAGSISVELQDPSGVAIPGFALADCTEIFGNRLEAAVRWRSGEDVATVAGRAVRIRFVLKDADLFAMQFQPRGAKKLIQRQERGRTET